MSNTFDRSFGQATNKFLVDNQFLGKFGSKALDVILLAGGLSGSAHDKSVTNKLLQFRVGLGYFEIAGSWDSQFNILSDCSVDLVVPVFGRAKLLHVDSITFTASSPSSGPLAINSALADAQITGSIIFAFCSDCSEILMQWSIQTPFTDPMVESDGVSLFPVNFSNHFSAERFNDVPRLNDAQIEKIRNAPFPAKEIQNDIIATGKRKIKFFADFNIAKQKEIRIVTYYQSSAKGGNSWSALPAGESSQSFSLNQSFGPLELVGTLDPADLSVAASLYVRVPVAGRIKITGVKGSLANGGSIEANIDVVLAHGKATLTAPDNGSGKHDLTIDATITISMVGDIKTGAIKLLTLPF
ncbi:hypothetical protein FB451DRAFT_1567226 [Mycena latifolia]|nr:hypothetical protein FB451DRAFT_1567226 [Mycena latifolia]